MEGSGHRIHDEEVMLYELDQSVMEEAKCSVSASFGLFMHNVALMESPVKMSSHQCVLC